LNEAVEPLAPVANAVEPVVEPLTPLIEPITHATEDVLEPVLQQPVIDNTVTLVNNLVDKSTEALTGVDIDDPLNLDPLTSAEALPLTAAASVPGPAAVKVTAVTPDTRVTNVPAAGSLSS